MVPIQRKHYDEELEWRLEELDTQKEKMIDEFDERKYRLNRLSDMIEEEIGNLERVITSTSLLTRPQTIKRFEEVKREM